MRDVAERLRGRMHAQRLQYLVIRRRTEVVIVVAAALVRQWANQIQRPETVQQSQSHTAATAVSFQSR
ncbi:hypothetical protein IVB18_14575 [Bradyrhizobium sp. 186]|uniref:hypothetical protein n=1 Tax=Bradyrhizobium sp. 186 TaxID=2782654 RepID=UPI002000F581|nr:hypothetical protein [Bradyrhizobium sp. 186]UPK38348.1 hypothetical protein IVB18_14575 [Bradyrhizobium sp. 186]